MKKHLPIVAVAASVMFAQPPAQTQPASSSQTVTVTVDYGSSIWNKLKPTLPPHAPRRY